MRVLYEDNHIIVAIKPVNVPSQEDKTADRDMLTMIKEYVKEKYEKPGNVYIGLIHRLDRPVGGIMVFARTSKAASRLSEEVRNKSFNKKYLAIVNGKFEEKSGTFVDQKNNTSFVVKKSKKGAKRAELDYEVLNYNPDENLSLVKIDLKTGRHHQIRVQFSSRGHALYGDNKYHGRSNSNICLFAYQLSFVHPVTKDVMNFEEFPIKNGMWKMIDGI